MRSRINRAALLGALLAGVGPLSSGGSIPRSTPAPKFIPNSPRFGYRRRDTKARFDRAHTNRRRKLALVSKRRNR